MLLCMWVWTLCAIARCICWWNLTILIVVGVAIDLQWIKFHFDDGKFNLIGVSLRMKTICQFIFIFEIFALCLAFARLSHCVKEASVWAREKEQEKVQMFLFYTHRETHGYGKNNIHNAWQWKTRWYGQDSEYQTCSVSLTEDTIEFRLSARE